MNIYCCLQKYVNKILKIQNEPEHITDHVSLALLSHAKVLKPLPTATVSITRVLGEKVRSHCILALSDENTFLTDITINAFCVS